MTSSAAPVARSPARVMGESRPRLSIGLPVRNGATTLEAALRSLLAQSFGDFELLISDNASTDDTEAIGRSFAAADRRVRYERTPGNIGMAPNFNRVFARTRGALFKWATSDDVCLPGYLAACISVLDTRPDVVLAYARTQFIDAEGRTLPITDAGWHLPQESPADRFIRVLGAEHWVNSILGVIRRSALSRTRRLPNYPGGDHALLGELCLMGKLVEVPEVLYHRRLHDRSMSQHWGETAWVAEYWGRRAAASLPLWCRSRDHLRSVLHADLPLRRKVALFGKVLIYMRDAGSRLKDEIRDTLSAVGVRR